MKSYKYLIIAAVSATTLPFLLLFGRLNTEIWAIDRGLFITQLSALIASIAGFMGMSLFLWQFILGIRSVSRLLSRDAVWLMDVHKWIGTYGSVLIFLHPLMVMYAYGENLLYLFIPSFANTAAFHITLGRLAFILFLIIFTTSAIARGRIKYRPWLYIHYLTYPMLLFVFIHAMDIGTVLQSYPVLEILWMMLLVGYGIVVAYRLWNGLGFGKAPYEITAVTHKGDGNMVFKMKPLKKFIKPRAGQYCYIQQNRIGEGHPFSVVSYSEQTHELIFGIKKLGGFTEQLDTLKVGDKIFLDGPYGVFTQEAHNDAPKVLIAGGIGITPFVDVVRNFSNESTYLLYCNRMLSDAVFRDTLKAHLGDRYYDVLSKDDCKDHCIITKRLDADVIRETVPGEILQQANFFFCGNPKMYKALQNMLAELGVAESRLFYEKFSL